MIVVEAAVVVVVVGVVCLQEQEEQVQLSDWDYTNLFALHQMSTSHSSTARFPLLSNLDFKLV